MNPLYILLGVVGVGYLVSRDPTSAPPPVGQLPSTPPGQRPAPPWDVVTSGKPPDSRTSSNSPPAVDYTARRRRAYDRCIVRCDRSIECDPSFWPSRNDCVRACQQVSDTYAPEQLLHPGPCFDALDMFDACIANTRDCGSYRNAVRGASQNPCTALDYARSDACERRR